MRDFSSKEGRYTPKQANLETFGAIFINFRKGRSRNFERFSSKEGRYAPKQANLEAFGAIFIDFRKGGWI